MTVLRRIARPAVPVFVTVLLAAAPAAAQEAEKPWNFEASVGISVFYGASDQTAIGLDSKYDYTAESLEFEVGGSFDYAEAQDPGGLSYVSLRGWGLSTSLDYAPESRLSPFALLNGEGSLARGIDRRLSGGLGAKVRFIDEDAAKLDFSLAALAERTEPRHVAGEPDVVNTQGRWSARLRGNRSWDDRRYATGFVTSWKPALSDPSEDYTLDVEATFDIRLNGHVSLQFRLLNKFDSLAESRGARDNNDGRFYVTLLTKL